MIYVMATITVAAGRRDDFLAQLNANVPKVRAEDGCVQYVPTIDIETNIDAQPDARQHVVTVVEQWESLAALEVHLVAPHMLEYRAKVKELVTNVELRIVAPA